MHHTLSSTALKLIAILPPGIVAAEIRTEQEYIAKQWGPKHALQTPPHITLIPPLSVTPPEVQTLWVMAEKIATLTVPFNLNLDGFGAFKPRVVFIRPVMTPEMNQLYLNWRKELMAGMPHVLNKYPDRPYHPHMTLAHRDVTPEQFKPIWNHYADRAYSMVFEIKSFWILKHVSGGWMPEREFPFNK